MPEFDGGAGRGITVILGLIAVVVLLSFPFNWLLDYVEFLWSDWRQKRKRAT